jgi:hypothetical protein
LLVSAECGVRRYLHHRVEVLQIYFGEVGLSGEMIEIDRLRRQSLARQINVIRAGAAKATAPSTTACVDWAKVKNVQGSLTRIRGKVIEDR